MPRCSDEKCPRPDIKGHEYLTEVNPQGGYGRDRVLVCDICMQSGRWDGWKSRHWRNWPDTPREMGDD